MTLDELLQLVRAQEVARKLEGIEQFPQLIFIQRILREAHPRGVDATVWVAPTVWSLNRQDVRLLTFAHFRSAYTIIERMARALASAALEVDVLPTIVPFDPENLKGMTGDTPFVRRVRDRGLVLYRIDRA